MKFVKTEKVEYDVKYLIADVQPRYWEDARINGFEDTENGDNIPCKMDENWLLEIELETGIIKNWEQGKTANVHYKVCDCGEYFLKDEYHNTIIQTDGYVPKMLCPAEDGYGDYIIMDIDENGKIDKWKADLSYFDDDED